MANYNFKQLDHVMTQWSSASPTGVISQEVGEVPPQYTFHNADTSNITCIAGGTEMLRVANDGFYVRGVKVPADDREVSTVYNAFKQFLTWAELHRK